MLYSYDEAKEYINRQEPTFLTRAKKGFICPYCDQGKTKGQGITRASGRPLLWHCVACRKERSVLGLYAGYAGIADEPKNFPAILEGAAAFYNITLENGTGSHTAPAGGRRSGDRRTRGQTLTKATQGAETASTEATADYTAYYEKCAARIDDPAAVSYLQERGISIETARRFGIGFDPAADPANAPGATGNEYKPHPCPRIIAPTYKAHYVARRIDGKEEYKALNPLKKKGAGDPGIFNKSALYMEDAQAVFVTEGVFDALAILEAGGAAVSICSAQNADSFLQQLQQAAPTAEIIILALDNDSAGTDATEAISAGLAGMGIDCIDLRTTVFGGCKDPNAALQIDREAFINAVEQAQRAAKAELARKKENARREEMERQQRTGAGLVDAFLQAVKSEKYKPIPTGITDIDRALYGGFTRQTLILLGAAPGAGKTALAQWIFEGMAANGHTCLYINLEMSRDQLLSRSIARIAAQNGDEITPAEVKQGYQWDVAQEIIVTTAAEEYKKTIAPRMIYNPDGVGTDLDSILEYIEAEATRAEAAGMPAPLIVLDYLQIITGRDREDETALIKRAVGSFKRFAIKHNTVVFCIIAHNRAANQSGTVTQESGRDTSALEYSADLQLGLAFTKCLKRPGQEAKKKEDLTPEEMKYITLKITKGRDAKMGEYVDLIFDGKAMTYRQITRREEPQRRRM